MHEYKIFTCSPYFHLLPICFCFLFTIFHFKCRAVYYTWINWLFREAIVDKGLILRDSFTGWSVLMHFHSQTSTKNISPPPPHLLLRLCLALGKTLNPAPWSKFSAENRHCQLQIHPTHGLTSALCGENFWSCRCDCEEGISVLLSFPEAQWPSLERSQPGTELQLPRGGRGWVHHHTAASRECTRNAQPLLKVTLKMISCLLVNYYPYL